MPNLIVKKPKQLYKASSTKNGEENWETIIDFTKIKKGGVPVEDIVAARPTIKGLLK